MKRMFFLDIYLATVAILGKGAVEGLALDDIPIKRIIGGQEASSNQFPWIVEVVIEKGSRYEHKCGGSLIGTEWVITSATCMFFNFESHRKIKIGEYDLLHESGRETEHEIDKIHVHKDFLTDGYAYDIALLKISPPADLSKSYVQTIHLPEKNKLIPSGTNCVIAGWGSTVGGTTEYSNVLRYAEMPTVSYETCASVNDKLPYSNIHPLSNICAGDLSGKSGCNRDSGGPLACKNADDEWILQGIVSWGDVSCNGAKFYSVCTRVSSFIDWINEEKTAEPFQPPKGCVDVHDHCQEWSKIGYCKWSSYIKGIYCKKTCGSCLPAK